jgi:hypothetical protein
MGTRNYRMLTTELVLRRGLAGEGSEVSLSLDPAFQGLPDTAHGGSVLAAFGLLAGNDPVHTLHGRYLRRVPVGVPLRLLGLRAADGLRCQLLDGGSATLVEGHVTLVSREGGVEAQGPCWPPVDPAPLPVSSTCFACGTDNALGLRVGLGYDARTVGGTWTPPAVLVAGDGGLAPIALTSLLDEAAFWLGALASGESGMTTDLAVTLHDTAPFGRAIRVAGARDRVRRRPDDPRYWDTEVAACLDDGRLLAHGRITFVAVRGAARKLAAWLRPLNPPGVVERVFPAYAD